VLSHTLFFHSSCDHRDLHSFPTRRSSDLQGDRGGEETRSSRAGTAARSLLHPGIGRTRPDLLASQRRNHSQGDGRLAALRVSERSEEHTSELQSPYDLVCRLLLEKKKNTY